MKIMENTLQSASYTQERKKYSLGTIDLRTASSLLQQITKPQRRPTNLSGETLRRTVINLLKTLIQMEGNHLKFMELIAWNLKLKTKRDTTLRT